MGSDRWFEDQQAVASRPVDLLTEKEQEALELTKQLANAMWAIIKAPRMIVQRDEGEDWRYCADHIHAIQHMIMSQAAARAYPDKYRPLGGGRLDL